MKMMRKHQALRNLIRGRRGGASLKEGMATCVGKDSPEILVVQAPTTEFENKLATKQD